MKKLFALFLVISMSLATSTAFASHPPAVQVQCFDDTGDSAIGVLDRGHGMDLSGSVTTREGDTFRVAPLWFRKAGLNLIWRGRRFLLRVSTSVPTIPGEFAGRFRGRDDSGSPVILRDLSCAVAEFIPFSTVP
jgi:hypothetical protein